MSFIESYKHLDKICGEMFETQYGVSAYIEEMQTILMVLFLSEDGKMI